jgi:hypothetical protein
MKTFLATALALGLIGHAGAQDKKPADPAGTWALEYDIGGQKREATLTIKKDGDKYEGQMAWPDKNEAKLKDVKWKDNELTFTAERKFMDMTFTIKYSLKFDGDKFKGKGEADFGGETRSFDIEGKKEVKK